VAFDIALVAAQTLVRLNPGMTFIYVSGTGADSSEHGRVMWARVRRQTENALLRLPFKWSFLYKSFPQFVTTTEQIRRGMLRIAKRGAAPKPILEARDINGL
jgi:hypothetical protein